VLVVGLELSTEIAVGGSAIVKANAPPASNEKTLHEIFDEIFVMMSLQAAAKTTLAATILH
jgi:hypothetical protein